MRTTRENWCKHYNGLVNDKCKAGVVYLDVVIPGKQDTKQPPSVPCFKDQNPLGAVCDKCEFRTPEEVEQERERIQKRIENIGKALSAIVTHLGPSERGIVGEAGTIDCPVCKAKHSLRFSRAYNGHIHAKCATEGCVSWIE